MTAPFLLDEMSEKSTCLAGRSTYVALHMSFESDSETLPLAEVFRKSLGPVIN